jgi:hypothetical protein
LSRADVGFQEIILLTVQAIQVEPRKDFVQMHISHFFLPSSDVPKKYLAAFLRFDDFEAYCLSVDQISASGKVFFDGLEPSAKVSPRCVE